MYKNIFLNLIFKNSLIYLKAKQQKDKNQEK